MENTKKSFVLDRKDIPADEHAYIFRNPQNKGKWYLYFFDVDTSKRYRRLLKDERGKAPEPISETADEAFALGLSMYVELRNKADRGEAITSLTYGDMVQAFLNKEKKKISDIPHNGITEKRWLLLVNQCRWISDYVNDEKRPVHKFKRNYFLNYESWRKQRAKDFGKEIPKQTTISHEVSTLRRLFKEIGETEGYINRDNIPDFPSIRLPKDKSHRRDDFTEKEWLELERCARLYYIKGKTRILDKDYTIEKDKKGKWKTKSNITFSAKRGYKQIVHREMSYLAMRIMMDTGMRPGSLRKLKWRDIKENTNIPKEERKVWVNIDVSAENTKTGRSYRVAAPIARHLEQLFTITCFKKAGDLLFANQDSGQPISERIWQNNLADMLVESRLANWKEGSDSQKKWTDINSGKNLTWYSFRHTYITMRLSAGVPLPVIASNTDTSMKYINEHYFHYRADESTQILGKGRKVRAADSELKWVDSLT